MSCQEILKGLSILYAEDEESIREMLKDVLKDEFKRFVTAENGVIALEKFKENGFDIVITDIEMPRMDGFRLTEEIKKISKKTPVILLTAYSEKERLFRAIDVGVIKYLVKPFTPEKLLEIICEISKKELEIDKKILLAENLYYDKLRKEVVDQNDVPIKLTKKELKFLELLIKNRGRIVTLQEIENTIWESENFTHTALRALVKRVRQKTSKELIKNFPGIGYKLVEKK